MTRRMICKRGCATKRIVLVLTLGAVLLWSGTSARAQLDADCTSAKLKKEGKAAAKVVKCYAKAAKKGLQVDPACILKAQMKLADAFDKADGDDPCWDGQGFEWSLVAEAGDALESLLYPPTLNSETHFKCASAKLKLASLLASKKASCQAKAVKKGVSVDVACLGKAEAKFAAAFQDIEAAGGCGTSGDSAATKAFVDRFVDSAVKLLAANQLPIRCCSATATVTLTGIGTFTVSGCADMLIGTCPQAATLLAPIGGSATEGVPGTVCDGAVGSCQAAPTGTSTCCEASKDGLQICAEGPSLQFNCSLVNGQKGVTFAEHKGWTCKDHYPQPPTCEP